MRVYAVSGLTTRKTSHLGASDSCVCICTHICKPCTNFRWFKLTFIKSKGSFRVKLLSAELFLCRHDESMNNNFQLAKQVSKKKKTLLEFGVVKEFV